VKTSNPWLFFFFNVLKEPVYKVSWWFQYRFLRPTTSQCIDILYSEFYIRGSVHRNSTLKRSKNMQQYAGIYLMQNHSTCFGCPSYPSSEVHKTVTPASGTGHSIW